MSVLYTSNNIILIFLWCNVLAKQKSAKIKGRKKKNKKNTIIGCLFVCIMVFNATFNNIPVISWRPVLLVEETGVPVESHQPVANH
jgi:hypothetical protein